MFIKIEAQCSYTVYNNFFVVEVQNLCTYAYLICNVEIRYSAITDVYSFWLHKVSLFY